MRQHVLNIAENSTGRVQHSLAAPSDFISEFADTHLFRSVHPVEIRPTTNPLLDLQSAHVLASVVNGGAYDIVHCHGVRGALVGSLSQVRHRIPTIATFHNMIGDSWKFRGAFLPIRTGLLAAIAVSSAVADSLRPALGAGFELRTIPNAVSPRFMLPVARDLASNRIGCAARLSPEKGVDLFVSAARDLPQSQFRVAGDGPLLSEMAGLAGPNVEFMGKVDDMLAFYDANGMQVVPSRQEGQGLSALEAMARGLPLVAACVGGLREMLVDRVDSILVEPENPRLISDALKYLNGNPEFAADIASAARLKVETSYAMGGMIEALEAFYGDVLDR